MRFIGVTISGAILIAGGLSCAAPTEIPPLFPRTVVVHEASTDTVRDAYAATIDALLPQMGHAEELQRQESQRAFETICLDAARRGAEAHRSALCRAIAERLGSDTPKPARVWMLRQIERIGRGEVVSTLTALLNDPDARIRELARRCLQHNPHLAAGDVLRQTLARVRSPAWKVALINALAARGESASLPMLIELTNAADTDVATAALLALGDIGGPNAADVLTVSQSSGRRELRGTATTALLRCAEKLVADGARAYAAGVYDALYTSSDSSLIRTAALRGLVRTKGDQMVPVLLDLITGNDEALGVLAARLAEEIPGEATTRALIEKLNTSQATAQVRLLQALAGRGDAAALSAAAAALVGEDEQVRMAALQALGSLGGRAAALALVEHAGRAQADELDAAREALARVPGAGVDETLVAAIDNAEPMVRAELIRALGARHYTPASPKWLFKAASHEHDAVQIAALNVLADVAREEDLPGLLRLLMMGASDDVRAAAVEAVVATCLRVADTARRAKPVLAVLKEAEVAAQPPVLRVLGRIGGADALAALRSARASDDSAVRDAAIRALAKWPDADAIDDLLEIAGTASEQPQRVLALRGYVRLVRAKGGDPAGTLTALNEAMAVADRPEDKKLVLAAVGDVAHTDALKLAESYLDDSALCDEAAVAMLGIAEKIAAAQRGLATAAIQRVQEASVSDGVRKKSDEALQNIERFDSYSTAWMIAGPYSEQGKGLEQLFTTPFAPELLGAEAEWKPLQITDPTQPWRFNLAQAVGGGNRCVYAKTMVWSEGSQPARLEIGSDDGVKVWLNGNIVHETNVARGLTVAEDKVDVTLQPGWNELLLKVTQGGGDWGFCAGIRAPDGSKTDGLKFKAE